MYSNETINAFAMNPNPESVGGFSLTMDMVSKYFWQYEKSYSFEIEQIKFFPFLDFFDVDYNSVQVFCSHVIRANVVTFKCKLRDEQDLAGQLGYWIENLGCSSPRSERHRPEYIVVDDYDDFDKDRSQIVRTLKEMGSNFIFPPVNRKLLKELHKYRWI